MTAEAIGPPTQTPNTKPNIPEQRKPPEGDPLVLRVIGGLASESANTKQAIHPDLEPKLKSLTRIYLDPLDKRERISIESGNIVLGKTISSEGSISPNSLKSLLTRLYGYCNAELVKFIAVYADEEAQEPTIRKHAEDFWALYRIIKDEA